MTHFYALFADDTLLLHVCYVLFVIVGQILIVVGWIKNWSWTQRLAFRLVHLARIDIVVVQSRLGVICPLTLLEANLREKSGEIGGG